MVWWDITTWSPLLRGLFCFALCFIAPSCAVIWAAYRDEKKKGRK